MASTLHQFGQALISLMRDLSNATQTTIAPAMGLGETFRPFLIVRAANHGLVRLFRNGVNAKLFALQVSSRESANRAFTISPKDFAAQRFVSDSLQPSRNFAGDLRPLTVFTPFDHDTRAIFDLNNGLRSMEISMSRFAGVVARQRQKLSRFRLISRNLTVVNTALKSLRLERTSQRLENAESRGSFGERRATPTPVTPFSFGKSVFNDNAEVQIPSGLLRTFGPLNILAAYTRVNGRSSKVAESRRLFSTRRAISHLSRHYPVTSSSNRTMSLLIDGGSFSIAKIRRTNDLASTITPAFTRPARLTPPPVAFVVRDQNTHISASLQEHLEPQHSEAAIRRRHNSEHHSLLPSTATLAAVSPPSTINVAINVHGVANGDDFIRRHGYMIAQVVDQVMERRARRAF